MKTGSLICYTLGPDTTTFQRNKLRKLLLGYTDYSNKSQYQYLRNGLLKKIPSIRLIRSVFIVRNEDSEKVLNLLKEFKAKVYVKKIILTNKDRQMLGL